MVQTITVCPEDAAIFASSAMRRRFSCRSSAEKPRPRQRPVRTVSPSIIRAACPDSSSFSSASAATVDLPEPESPVIQNTAGRDPVIRMREAAPARER